MLKLKTLRTGCMDVPLEEVIDDTIMETRVSLKP